MENKGLLMLSTSLLISSTTGIVWGSTQPKKPNIVFIMADDHAYQAISAYGCGLNKTPNIDKLAQGGMLFRNCFVSNSISGPCRAVILTGKFSHKNGFYDNQAQTVFDGSQQTFPKLLQAAGYQTAVIGKWHLGSTPTGFDYYSIHQGQGTYYSPLFIEPEGKKKYDGAYATDLTLENSEKWLDRIDKNKPFCLMMHFKAPHRNWMPAPGKMDMYEDTTFPLPSNFFDDYKNRQAAKEQLMSIDKDMTVEGDLKMIFPTTGRNETKGELNRMTPAQRAAFDKVYKPLSEKYEKEQPTGKDLAIWKYQRYMRDYLKCISSVDDNVGKMVEYLKKNGLWENTIVVYTSDQGFYLGEHGWFDKRFMYEESMHTPLIISYPKLIKPSTETKAMVQNIDFAPTFLDLAGIKIPSDIQGVSMKPVLNGSANKIHDGLYYHYYEYPRPHGVKRHYGIRTERYKLIHFYYDIDKWELYDLKNDPKEMKNLIDDRSYAKVVKDLKIKLQELQKKYDDLNPMEGYPVRKK